MDFNAMTDSQMSRFLSEISSSLSSLESSDESLQHTAREKISNYRPSNQKDETSTILEGFLDHLPEHGCKVLCKAINENEGTLDQLAKHLLEAVLNSMRISFEDRTPFVEESPFADPDEVDQSVSDQQWLRTTCLKRDQYRCTITRIFDLGSKDCLPDISDEAFNNWKTRTRASHIIPFKLGKVENNAQDRALANLWTTLYALFPDLNDVIGPDSVNEPRNVITVWETFNIEFGQFTIALEATNDENVYKIKTYKGFSSPVMHFLPAPDDHGERLVHFTKPSDIDTELPSPVILATHATIAQILNAQGMAEIINNALRDLEELRYSRVLSNDNIADLTRYLPVLVAS